MMMEALEQAGLLPLALQPARVLSGGEQQRLALARAWALKPQVLFLDEPTASLDPAATQAVEALLDYIHHTGTKIIMTTHDWDRHVGWRMRCCFCTMVGWSNMRQRDVFSNPQSKEADRIS